MRAKRRDALALRQAGAWQGALGQADRPCGRIDFSHRQRRVGRKFFHGANKAESDLRISQTANELFAIERGESLADNFIESFPITNAVRVSGKEWMADDFRRMKNGRAKAHPFGVILDGDHHGAPVARGVGAVGGDRSVVEAGLLGDLTSVLLEEEGNGHPIGNGFEKRDGNMTPAASALALEQSFEDPKVSVQAGTDVTDGNADFRRAGGITGDGEDAGFGLNQVVIGAHAGVLAGLAVAADGAGNQSGIRFAEFCETQARAVQSPRREVLHENVRPPKHGAEGGKVIRLFEIEYGGFLALIQPDKMRALAVDSRVIVPREVSFRWLFNFDHSCPGLCEPRSGIRRCNCLFDGNDEEAG